MFLQRRGIQLRSVLQRRLQRVLVSASAEQEGAMNQQMLQLNLEAPQKLPPLRVPRSGRRFTPAGLPACARCDSWLQRCR